MKFARIKSYLRRLKSSLFPALVLAGLLTTISLPTRAALTNFPNGVGIGTTSAGTYSAVTGVALTYREVSIEGVRLGNAVDKPIPTPQATVVYISAISSLSCLTWAAASDSTNSVTARFEVPGNYRSGGIIQALVSFNTTDAAARLRADTTVQTPGSAFNGTVTTGTAVDPSSPTTAWTWVTLTNAQVYSPRDEVSVQIVKTAGTIAIIRVAKIRFGFRPYGVFP